MNCIHILDDSHVFVINKKNCLEKTAYNNEKKWNRKTNGEQLVPKLFVEM